MFHFTEILTGIFMQEELCGERRFLITEQRKSKLQTLLKRREVGVMFQDTNQSMNIQSRKESMRFKLERNRSMILQDLELTNIMIR